MSNWYDNEDFWKTLERFFFSQIRTDEIAKTEADQITRLLQSTPGSAVLDLACGPGRHSLELARRGYRVTGVDRTKRYLDTARTKADAEQLHVEFVQEDMRRFERPDSFDVALNLFSSFGYFEDPEDDLKVLRNLCRSLKPGGKLLMELVGKEWLAREFQAQRWHHHAETDEYLLEQVTVRSGWDWLDNHWIWIKGHQRKVFDFGLRVYSGVELTAALRRAGLSTIELYGSLDATPYDDKAQRLVALARR